MCCILNTVFAHQNPGASVSTTASGLLLAHCFSSSFPLSLRLVRINSFVTTIAADEFVALAAARFTQQRISIQIVCSLQLFRQPFLFPFYSGEVFTFIVADGAPSMFYGPMHTCCVINSRHHMHIKHAHTMVSFPLLLLLLFGRMCVLV